MKKEELTALGMTDEQAAKVLEMHGKEQNEAASKLSEAENKLAAAEKNAKELTEKVKAFDGVDLEALRKSAADWETKYNTDIAKAKLDSAVELALTKAGAKDVGLARHLIDTSILKLDGDKVIGLAEQLEKAKTDKAFLFGDEPAKETARIDTGIDHGGATDTISDAQIRAVMGLPTETK
nr:MAG TPA: minor structural protein [Caudoviricetes sp.]